MNQLSTDLKFAVIVFFDGSKLLINQSQYQNVINAISTPDAKQIRLNGNIYYVGGIQKVLSLPEFYQEYPKEKPAVELPSDKDTALIPDYRSPELSQNGRQQIIKGMESEIARMEREGKNPAKAKKELAKYQSLITV